MKSTWPACTPLSSDKDEASNLIASQINFGLAYVDEARSAYEAGNFEYGEIARKIALNAYSAALRFSSNLLREPQPVLASQLEDFELQLDALLEPAQAGMRSIA